MHRGTLAHKQGKLLVQEYFGRPIVFATLKSGKILPMYRSKYGTSGKKQNAWYPCF
jgi:hypothetical protein